MSDKEIPFSTARLGAPPDDVAVKHSLAPQLKRELSLLPWFVEVDMAHVVMLWEEGILTEDQARGILTVLRDLERDGVAVLSTDPKYGSLLLQVERLLEQRLGEDTAGRLHTGRSRNDQSSAVQRLAARDDLLQVFDILLGLQDTVLGMAERHVHTYMPGYTHLQHAQPTTLGHYLMRHYFTFERDQERLQGAFLRTNRSALGGVAMTGTSWPINRHRVAELLGHEGLIENAYDAGVFARDYPAEIAAVLSLLLSNLGRLAADLYLWSSWEFGMVEISDALAGTSSIMPQKKNPNAIERIRGLCGSSIGWFPSIVGTLRSSSASDLDLHFAGDRLGDMSESTVSALELMRSVLETLVINTETMRERAAASWSTATNLADEAVRRSGISFRAAHQVVGRVVRSAIQDGLHYGQITGAHVDRAAQETIGRPLGLSDEVVQEALDPEGAVNSLVTEGSAHPEAVKETIQAGRARQAGHRGWHRSKRDLIKVARRNLASAVDDAVN